MTLHGVSEVGDISPALQLKLLRVLQEHRVRPVGGSTEEEVDLRLIFATNRDLEELVRHKKGSSRAKDRAMLELLGGPKAPPNPTGPAKQP